MEEAQTLEDFLMSNGLYLGNFAYSLRVNSDDPSDLGNNEQKYIVIKNLFGRVDVYKLSTEMYNIFEDWIYKTEKKTVSNLVVILNVTYGSLILAIANYFFNFDNTEFIKGSLTTLIGVCFFLAISYLNRKPDFVEPVFSGNQENVLQYLKVLYKNK
ncbi:MAG: hypothetical protein QXM96_03285 [Candidatus Woesearchaeota archaeon]